MLGSINRFCRPSVSPPRRAWRLLRGHGPRLAGNGWLLPIICLSMLSTAALGQLRIVNPQVTDLRALGIGSPQGITYHPTRGTLFILTRTRITELSTRSRTTSRATRPVSPASVAA